MSRYDDQDEESSVDPAEAQAEWSERLGWLADADRDKAEEHFSRLAGDRELAAELERQEYTGADYDAFANEVARYGWAVMRGWIYKNQIHDEVRKKGFGSLEPEPRPGAMVEDAEGLADETVVRALNGFREKVLLPGKWDPAKGASLRTYFVGQCLLQFSNVYKTWHRQEMRSYAEPQETNFEMELDGFEQDLAAPRAPGADARAVVTDELRRAFGSITDSRARSAFYLSVVHGYSYEEIGRKLDMTGKAVESALARARLQAKRARERA